MRRAVLAAVAAVAALAAPGTASGQCPEGARCGNLTVPLDHAGRTAGTLPLAYATLPATGARTGTLVVLTGGPGQAAIPILRDFASFVSPLRSSFDIVAVDQRGTGRSGAVECEEVEQCVQRLGDRRAFLNTPETARDLEDLRVALGVEQLTLYGVSYGAKVASEYARRYPERTAALVLDSPAPVDGIDGVDELRVLALPRVLREVCFPGVCAATVPDAGAALTAAVERLPLTGPLVGTGGQARNFRVTEYMLYRALTNSDTYPLLRRALPAAVASLAAGDAAPFLHLIEVITQGDPAAEVNRARLLATMCIESRLPWAPESAVETRAAARDAYAAERAAIFAPFSPRTVLDTANTELCAAWPPTPRPDRVVYPGPAVPVLILSGREDLRTPLEDARRTAQQYPNARVLAVPSAGHSVLSTDTTDCAAAGMIAFLRRQTVERCERSVEVPAAPYAPATIGRLPPTRLPGLRGRTYSALTVTLTGIGYDTIAQPRRRIYRLPGLRAGYVTVRRNRLTLHAVEWIRGVRVSGTVDARSRTGTFTISGPAAAPGTVTITRSGARGTLGGRSFSLR
jgi:pimeloyl-ACP methyl ester carboxylesterase